MTTNASTDALATLLLAAVNAHDPDVIAALFAADAHIETPTLPGGSGIGPDTIRENYAALFRAFPDLHIEEIDRLSSADGSSVAILWTATATHTGPLDPPGFAPTFVRGASRGMSHSTSREGRITSFRLYYDLNDLGRQIGAVPPPGTAGARIGVMLQRMKARSLRRANR